MTTHNEETRLREFILAIWEHGTSTWANTSCGRGGIAGQAITTNAHPEVIDFLARCALEGNTLRAAADEYAVLHPSTSRLDEPPKRSGRAGPDGRPI